LNSLYISDVAEYFTGRTGLFKDQKEIGAVKGLVSNEKPV
jgi:hypothetical protein